MDISFLAEHSLRRAAIVGIVRAIDEQLRELADRPELDLTLVGVCGPDPVRYGSLAAAFARRAGGVYRHDRGFRSPLRFARAYDGLSTHISPDGLVSLAARGSLKVLKLVDARSSFRMEDYDVLHSTYMPLPRRSSGASTARVLSIYDVIPLEHPEVATGGQRAFTRDLLAGLGPRDWVIVNSGYVRERVCEHATVDESRVVVVPLGVSESFRPLDADACRAAAARCGVPPAPYVLSLSRPEPRKNLGLLVRAFRRVVEASPPRALNLVLAGGAGRQDDEVSAELRRHPELRSRIVEPGYVDEADLPGLYGGAAAFVHTSRAEGFGLPPLEAMRCGTPVVVARAGSLPEVAGHAALQFEPDDADALARAVETILDDAAARAELVERGLARSRLFTWRRSAAGIADVYARTAAAR